MFFGIISHIYSMSKGVLMQYYDDKANEKALIMSFFVFQVVMLLMVYGFVYTGFVGVQMAIQKYGLTFMAYLPVVAALIGFPVVLFKTRKIFLKKQRLRAVGWVMGWAAVIIVVIYLHLSKLSSL